VRARFHVDYLVVAEDPRLAKLSLVTLMTSRRDGLKRFLKAGLVDSVWVL
jgi:hypothetical protein